MKTKQQLIDRVLEEMVKDVKLGDLTVLEELLRFIPDKNLIQALNENEWGLYKDLDTRNYICQNCGGGFTHKQMVFGEDSDLCKECDKKE